MKKVFFALLTIIVLIGLVACNPTVDRKLWDCKVTFDSNGGSKTVAKYINSGKTITEPANPSNGEKIFAGWYTTADWKEGKEFDFNTPITEDVTLYAKWWNPYLTFISSESFSISVPLKFGIYDNKGNMEEGSIQWTTTPADESSWKNIENGYNIATADEEDGNGNYNLYFRGENNNCITNSWAWGLVNASADISVHGNIMTLLDYKNPNKAEMYGFEGVKTKDGYKNYVQCFYSFFDTDEWHKYLVSVSEDFLPAKNLAHSCYGMMFYGCKNLKNLPELPAKKLSEYCYSYMFCGCYGITSVPENYLPAKVMKEYCYQGMFNDCNGITEIPETLLHSEVLAEGCYQEMFGACGNLTNIPVLPAQQLKEDCYSNMFAFCNSLVSIPKGVFHAVSFANKSCYSMFTDCSSLETLPDDFFEKGQMFDTECCKEMFLRCKKLKTIPVVFFPDASTTATRCFCSMFEGTAIEEIPDNFLPMDNLGWACYLYMFMDCKYLVTIPENLLPAMTLSGYCYEGMFAGCSSLETIPENLLPAEQMEEGCYADMFMGCTSLVEVPQNLLPATKMADWCYGYWNNVDTNYYGMFSDCINLTKAPFLPTPTVSGHECYESMFAGCTSLKVTDKEPSPGTTFGVILCSLSSIDDNEYDVMFSYMGDGNITVEPGKTYYWFI